MDNAPSNSPGDDFDDIVSSVAGEWAANSAAQARRLLHEILDANEGVLSEHQAVELASIAKRDTRTIWRWRNTYVAKGTSNVLLADAPGEPAAADGPSDIFDALITVGPEAFEFNDVMISLMYLVGGSQSELRRILIGDGYPMPSLPTIGRKWKQVSPMQRDGAKHGVRNRANKLLHIRHTAAESNEAWQFDAFNLDIFVRTPNGTTPIRPTALLLIDDHSRFITSWVLMPHAMRSADVLAALGAGFEVRVDENGCGVLIGGWPDLLTFDNDAAILSDVVQDALSVLPTTLDLSPAYTPVAKGKVERVGATIQTMSIVGQPGRVTKSERRNGTHLLSLKPEHLLSFEVFEARFAEMVREYNYTRIHSALGTTPFDAYTNGLVCRSLSDAELAGLMMPVSRSAGQRLVHHDGLHVLSGYYAHACIGLMVGSKVEVRSWHHRHDKLAAFASGEFLGMVPQASHLTADQRRVIIGQRIDEYHAVHHHAAAARAALEAVGADAELDGHGTALSAMLAVKGIVLTTPNAAANDSALDLDLDDLDLDGLDSDDASGVAPDGSGVSGDVPSQPQPAKRRPPGNKATRSPTATAKANPVDTAADRARNIAAAALENEEPF